MIFVSLGTQDKQFPRLLKAVEQQIKKGNIKDEVIAQIGQTKYKSNYMKLYDFLNQNDFENYIKQCDILITHGGVGNILTGLNYNKKIIVAPRLSKYGEHTNDHQLQVAEKFFDDGYILKLDDFNRLNKLIEECKTFKPKHYKSNTKYFCECLKKELDKL